MGNQREQPKSQVLHTDSAREKRAQSRSQPVKTHGHRHRTRAGRTKSGKLKHNGTPAKPGDFNAEIEAHIRHEADSLIAEGMSPEKALAAGRSVIGLSGR